MSYDINVYCSPESLGLSPVAEIDWSDGCYQFDLRVVWKHESGVLYTARDSGCSCPSPFEDYGSLESLDRVGPDFRDTIRAEFDESYSKPSLAEYEDFLHAVDKALGVIEQEGLVRL